MCNKEEKKGVLKSQINFRKKVLGQSKNKRQLSIPELRQNLLLLIGDSEDSTVISNSDTNHIMAHPELLVGKRIRHCFQVGNKLVWFNGIVITT